MHGTSCEKTWICETVGEDEEPALSRTTGSAFNIMREPIGPLQGITSEKGVEFPVYRDLYCPRFAGRIRMSSSTSDSASRLRLTSLIGTNSLCESISGLAMTVASGADTAASSAAACMEGSA